VTEYRTNAGVSGRGSGQRSTVSIGSWTEACVGNQSMTGGSVRSDERVNSDELQFCLIRHRVDSIRWSSRTFLRSSLSSEGSGYHFCDGASAMVPA
jgi:hypothetical protein